jgi:hypothetical protein
MQIRIRNTISNVLTIVTLQHAEGFEDEPPLLEELGINPDHILQVRRVFQNRFLGWGRCCPVEVVNAPVHSKLVTTPPLPPPPPPG